MSLFQDALLSYAHIISNIFMGAALYTQLKRFQKNLSLEDAIALQKADAIYGTTALITLATGLIRAFSGPKGTEFYFSNPVFHVKLSLFIIIGLLSIYPTVVFLKWRRETRLGQIPVCDEQTFKKLRAVIFTEFLLFIFIPFFGALVARGIGLKI
jgi:putative membrane protein